MSRTFILAAMLLAGCGRVGFGAAADASQDWEPGTEVALDVLLGDNVELDDPSLTGDRLELYFNRRVSGNSELGQVFVAKRDSADEPFGSATLVPELTPSVETSNIRVSRNGLHACVAGGQPWILYYSQRASRDDPWAEAAIIPELNDSQYDRLCGGISGGGTQLLFHQSAKSAGSYDLYRVARDSNAAPWGTPRPLSGVNTEASDESGFYSEADDALYFASNRSGSLDLYVAASDPDGGGFAPPVRLQVNNSSRNDDPWVSPDGCQLFYSGEVDGARRLYSARRCP